jgi:hypothetical protein
VLLEVITGKVRQVLLPEIVRGSLLSMQHYIDFSRRIDDQQLERVVADVGPLVPLPHRLEDEIS